MYFADTICSGWSSWRGIENILVMAKFMNFDAVKHLIHPSVPLAYPFEWMNVIRRRPVWYFSRTHTVIVRGGLFKYHWKMQADCGNHISLQTYCIFSSVYSSQGCRPRICLQQQDTRLAAAYKVAECHFIFQNAAAAACSTCSSTPNDHQTHQETERQGRWDLPAVTCCFCCLWSLKKLPREPRRRAWPPA